MSNIHEEKAVEYYFHNFNCTQGVFTTYAIEHGIDEKLALKLATNFGGGARKGEMCGAVSGALMVLGLLYGHSESDDLDTKAKAYAITEEYMNRFIKKNGCPSDCCCALGLSPSSPSPTLLSKGTSMGVVLLQTMGDRGSPTGWSLARGLLPGTSGQS